MNRQEFTGWVTAFLNAPQPYRHLYLWHGEAEALSSVVPIAKTAPLDLFALAVELDARPVAQMEAQEVFSDALRDKVRAWARNASTARPILQVTGCELLACYQVGLHPFYEVLTGNRVVILVCSAADAAFNPAGRLPTYVWYTPGATLTYLSNLMEDNHIVEA
ncbi:MAG: hypothetical protein JXA33_09270 [Anaerolineae bacterium]|nr:hypothetical protein [Anaerolineae bacterium]